MQCARLAGDSHLGEERKEEGERENRNRRKEKRTLERKTFRSVTRSALQAMHTEGLKAEIVIETEESKGVEKQVGEAAK